MNDTAAPRSESEAAAQDAVARDVKIDIRDLNFYYGKAHALKHVNFGVPGECGDRDHRSFGVRQVDAAAHDQPHLRALS